MDSRYYIIISFGVATIIIISIALIIRRIKKKNKSFSTRITEIGDANPAEMYKKEIRLMLKNIESQIDNVNQLEELSQQCSEDYKLHFATQNPVIDTLLEHKLGICRSQDIDFSVKSAPLPAGLLSERELISLIGNLVDNAIEAACKCDERIIKFHSDMVAGQWIMKIVNTKRVEERPLENAMTTTKADKNNHGIGTRIIDKIISKNKGYIKRFDHGNSFEIFIAIPVKEI